MSQDFRAAVNSKVFGCRDSFQIVRVVALQAGNESHADATGEVGIFAISFLTEYPAGIAKNIDIGRPEGEAEIASGVSVLDSIVVFGAGFGGDHLGDPMNQVGGPSSGKTDGLRKNSCISGARDAVQAFVPPVVCGNAEARNCRSNILHLRNLFFEGHARDKIVNALLQGKAGFETRPSGWFLGCGGILTNLGK